MRVHDVDTVGQIRGRVAELVISGHAYPGGTLEIACLIGSLEHLAVLMTDYMPIMGDSCLNAAAVGSFVHKVADQPLKQSCRIIVSPPEPPILWGASLGRNRRLEGLRSLPKDKVVNVVAGPDLQRFTRYHVPTGGIGNRPKRI